MITVIKQDPRGNEKVRYQGNLIEHIPGGIIIQAIWSYATHDLGYTVFEHGDRLTEYFYFDRWFNVFEICTAQNVRKGWYCNIAEPAHIDHDHVEQIDLLLDVWVNPQGEPLILDEDEFAQDTTLTVEQRNGAQQGLQALLYLLTQRQDMFASIDDTR